MAAVDLLVATAEQLRVSLASWQQLTKEACELCDAAAEQMAGLGRSSRGMLAKTEPLFSARHNIQRAQARAGEVLAHLDASRQVGGGGGLRETAPSGLSSSAAFNHCCVVHPPTSRRCKV